MGFIILMIVGVVSSRSLNIILVQGFFFLFNDLEMFGVDLYNITILIVPILIVVY